MKTEKSRLRHALESGNGTNTVRRQGEKTPLSLEYDFAPLVAAVVNELCFSATKVRLKDVADEVQRRIDSDAEFKVIRDALRAEGKEFVYPAIETIRRRKLVLDEQKLYASRHGAAAAAREFRQYGDGVEVTRPLQRAELDFTPIDVLVLDEHGDFVNGRMTLAVMIDTFTRYPLGYYLGWEGESYLATMHCLYHAILPKEGLREFYNSRHEWKAYGIPEVIVTDNGKAFNNQSLRDTLATLGCTLQFGQPGKPWFRPFIERFFGSGNTGLFHQMDGTTFSNIAERGRYKSAEEATQFAHEIDREVFIFFVDEYAQEEHRGLGAIPARFWDRACAAAEAEGWSPDLDVSAEQLRIMLGAVTERALQKYGIDIWGMRYNNVAESKRLTILRRKLQHDGLKAKIKYHPGDLSVVHVHDPYTDEPDSYIALYPLRKWWERTRNLSLWCHNVMRSAERKWGDRRDPAELGAVKNERRGRKVGAKARKQTVRARKSDQRAQTRGAPIGQLKREVPSVPAPVTSVPVIPTGGTTARLAARRAVIAAEEASFTPERITSERARDHVE